MLARHEWASSASGAVPVVVIRGGITKADFKTAAALQRLGDEGDDAWRDERAVDPLHCARIDAKPSGDLAHTGLPGVARASRICFSRAGAIGAARGVLWARKPVSGPARTRSSVIARNP